MDIIASIGLAINCFPVIEANYSDHLGFNLLLNNHTDKDIKAVQGVLFFTDLFDSEILSIRVTMEDNVSAGQTV